MPAEENDVEMDCCDGRRHCSTACCCDGCPCCLWITRCVVGNVRSCTSYICRLLAQQLIILILWVVGVVFVIWYFLDVLSMQATKASVMING